MIEWRASLRRDIVFESGGKLAAGTIVYVRQHGEYWSACHYSDKGSGTAFALEPEDFSIWTQGSTRIEYVVAFESDPEQDRVERELARRRAQVQIENYREEADRLEELLKAGVA